MTFALKVVHKNKCKIKQNLENKTVTKCKPTKLKLNWDIENLKNDRKYKTGTKKLNIESKCKRKLTL